MSRKGLFLTGGGLGAISWQAGKQAPPFRATSITRGALLCICFPVANITARHCQDCHTAHPKHLLSISKSRARSCWLSSGAHSTQPQTKKADGSRQQDGIRDSPLPGYKREQRPEVSSCRVLQQPQHTQEKPQHKPREAGRGARTQARGDACMSLHIDDKKINKSAFGCKQPLGLIKSRLHFKTEEISYHRGTEEDEHLRCCSWPAFAWR